MSVTTPIRTEQPALSAVEIRDLLQQAVMADLLGPANGPEEVIDQGSVRDRYLIGRLGPQGQRWSPAQMDLSIDALEPDVDVAGEIDDEESTPDAPPPQAVSMQPSAMGLSFVVDGDATALRITAQWGRYVRETGKGPEYTDDKGKQRKIWQRVPMVGVHPRLDLREGRLPAWSPHPDQPEVRVEVKVRRRTDAQDAGWHVTLFLVNGQTEPKNLKDAAWLFQPQLRVEDADGQPIFVRRPLRDDSDDPEVRGMNMRYRDHLEFAVGHGVSVRAILPPGVRRQALALETQIAPVYDLPATATYTPPDVEIDMRVLQAVSDGQFGAVLGEIRNTSEKYPLAIVRPLPV